MMLYRVTSLAFDPDARTAYYTEDNYAFRDVLAVNVDTGNKRMLLKDARIGDIVLNPTDKSLWGIRHQDGFATIVRIPSLIRASIRSSRSNMVRHRSISISRPMD